VKRIKESKQEKGMELHMQVAQAVQVLNHDVQSCNRVAANQWLVQFQQSDSAWEAATSILNSDLPYPLEVQLFAAQILKRKVRAQPVPISLCIFLFHIVGNCLMNLDCVHYR
jgi:hypothetical protein